MSTALVQPKFASSSLASASSEANPVLPNLSESLDKAGKKISSRTLRWEISMFCSFSQALSINGAFDRATIEQDMLLKRHAATSAVGFHLSLAPALMGMVLLYVPAQVLVTLQKGLKRNDAALRQA